MRGCPLYNTIDRRSSLHRRRSPSQSFVVVAVLSISMFGRASFDVASRSPRGIGGMWSPHRLVVLRSLGQLPVRRSANTSRPIARDFRLAIAPVGRIQLHYVVRRFDQLTARTGFAFSGFSSPQFQRITLDSIDAYTTRVHRAVLHNGVCTAPFAAAAAERTGSVRRQF